MLLQTPLKKVICSFEEQYNEDNVDKNVYVFESKRTCEDNSIICTLSNGEIKIYDIETLQNTAVLNPVSNGSSTSTSSNSQNDININSLSRITNLDIHPTNDNIFGVSYEDGHARLYDKRATSATNSSFNENISLSNTLSPSVLDIKNNYPFNTSQPMECLAFGFDGNLLATGVANTIEFYDLRYLRKDSLLGRYNDAHSDDITRLIFHPISSNILASSGEDGLVCIYDTSIGNNLDASTAIPINNNNNNNNNNNKSSLMFEEGASNNDFIVSSKEEPLQCILNVDCPVRHTEFFG